MKFLRTTSIIFILSLLTAIAHSQTQKPTLETALQHFKNGDYALALQQYSALIDQYGKDPKFNHFYGACLVETNQNITQATKCLKFAALRGNIKESAFYLARALQLNYEFEEAIANYVKFLKVPSVEPALKERALQYSNECRTGISFVPKIYDLSVFSADTVSKRLAAKTIKLSPELGRLMQNSDFFESGIDPDDVLFITERGDRVFYSAKGTATESNDLFFMEKLIDGWSKATNLGSHVNSSSDEKYPLLLTDGITLYFSSNRPGGMGGWDIYKADYNTETKQFGEVTNMGIPFNSPMDDYLFVPDEFTKTAWFASNRATTADKAVVIRIAWDGSIVRNNVTDINQVKESAQLAINAKADAWTDPNAQYANNKKVKQENRFVFSVADTLEYTQYEHFRSEAALNEYKQGRLLSQKKDSLMVLMQQKRARYAASNADWERNAMVNDILRLEKETYSLDAAIKQYNFNAQSLEQSKIKELVRTGQYAPLVGTKVTPKKTTTFNIADIPQDLTLYSPDEFGKQLMEVQRIYPRLFSDAKCYQLQQADSLYAWGNLLNIESSRLLEKASKTTTTEVPLPKPFKNDISDQPTSTDLVKDARELKYKALTLYHQSLDVKYAIYSEKYTSSANEPAFKPYCSAQHNAASFKKEALELQEQALTTGNNELYEKSGTLKRKATEVQENGFFKYLEQLDSKHTIVEKAEEAEQPYALPAYSATHANNAQAQGKPATTTPQQPIKTTPSESSSTVKNIVFKIQIGVFRNQPNENALVKLSKVTTEVVPESGLTKYFAGIYNTYEQALNDLEKTKEAGFPGAFIVAFENDKQIPLQEARNNAPKN